MATLLIVIPGFNVLRINERKGWIVWQIHYGLRRIAAARSGIAICAAQRFLHIVPGRCHKVPEGIISIRHAVGMARLIVSLRIQSPSASKLTKHTYGVNLSLHSTLGRPLLYRLLLTLQFLSSHLELLWSWSLSLTGARITLLLL